MELRGYLTIDESGKYGGASQAAKFFWSRQKRNKIDHWTPYMEFCIDPDPEALCIIVENGQIFGKVLEKCPDLLGKAAPMFNNKLPFIIKVVSLGKIQPLVFHPAKVDAEELHKTMPHEYKDSEAKSKMIVALSLFEMFYGFRTKENITAALRDVPELSMIIPLVKQEDFFQRLLDSHLRDIILHWLSAPPALMKHSLDMFFERMEKQGLDVHLEYNVGLMKRLHQHCPYNPGVYAPLFLNHCTVSPGSALYIQPGIPHAFLSGDCLEVSSRNGDSLVLGLTEEADLHLWRSLQHVRLLCAPPLFLTPLVLSEGTTAFRPPTREFAVDRVQVRGGSGWELAGRDSGWVLLVVCGKATWRLGQAERALTRGSAIFVLPHQDLRLAVTHHLVLLVVYPNTQYNPSN